MKQQQLLPMNLQMFAHPTDPVDPAPQNPPADPVDPKNLLIQKHQTIQQSQTKSTLRLMSIRLSMPVLLNGKVIRKKKNVFLNFQLPKKNRNESQNSKNLNRTLLNVMQSTNHASYLVMKSYLKLLLNSSLIQKKTYLRKNSMNSKD